MHFNKILNSYIEKNDKTDFHFPRILPVTVSISSLSFWSYSVVT